MSPQALNLAAQEAIAAAPVHAVLVGAPNCGKTALFNALTGGRAKVANYPGVTVERKSGRLTTLAGQSMQVVDLPGTYSLRARGPDEEVTRNAVLGHQAGEDPPDLLICVADASNMRLSLRLVVELKRVGRPIVLVLNMADIAQRRGIEIDIEKLSALLGIPVVTATATRRAGLSYLRAALDGWCDLARKGTTASANSWRPPDAAQLRADHREADRIIKAAVTLAPHPDTLTGRLDAVLLHPVLGLVTLLALLFLMFQAVFAWATPLMDLTEAGFALLGQLVQETLPDGLVRSFITDAVISGVGGVIVFLPQIAILFLFILTLEDLGYMARAAFLMDKIMGGAGLHGRAFIPLLSSFACAIPGIMATRVIDSKPDRLTTILVAPLMTCSARIPVYTLIISAFIPNRDVWGGIGLQGLVMFGLYATGILSALVVSFVMKKLAWRDQPSPPFMLEMPDYKIPSPRNVVIALWHRVRAFLVRAGTTIFAMAVLIWVLASFPTPPEGASGPAINYSLAAVIGTGLQPLLAPVGFNWQITVALIPGMAAREVAVAALATMYAIDDSAGDVAASLGSMLAGQWSLGTALALLAWYIFAPQCASTLAVIRREAGGWHWAGITFAYMLALAWFAAFAVYQTAAALGFG